MYDYKDLMNTAKSVIGNAYAPYSKFPVSAALLYENDNVYTGVNVENASYGLSLCAERSAVSKAVSEGEKSKPVAIAVFSPLQKNCFPCGACRQWLSEFQDGELDVVLEYGDTENAEDANIKVYKISELLPHSFKIH